MGSDLSLLKMTTSTMAIGFFFFFLFFFFFFFFFFWSVAVGSDKPRYMRTDDFETLIARDRKGWDVKEVVF